MIQPILSITIKLYLMMLNESLDDSFFYKGDFYGRV